MENSFFEMLMENLSDGVYVLNREARFIYVNAAYCENLHVTRESLLGMDVHEYLKRKEIDFCITDMVMEQKKQVIVFQDVYDSRHVGRRAFRQLVKATPLFDEKGEIQYVFAVLRKLSALNEEYRIAGKNEVASRNLQQITQHVEEREVIAESPQMQDILMICRQIADTDASVLITGDSGTGKEVIASYIHNISNRKDAPLVVINCASLPENLLEAELFGYEKGSFTGAVAARKGLFEQADQGTLFLDEINSMPLGLQSKLLRAIETKSIRRIGSNKVRKVDFRLLVATNENLENLIEAKAFRKDLYYRINVVPIRIPPLRERREDIVPLALHFLQSYCNKSGKEKSFSPQMLDKIRYYSWPGNVRELKNFVERSVLMSLQHSISIPDISSISMDAGIEAEPGMIEEREEGFMRNPEKDFSRLVSEGTTITQYLEDQERELLKWARNTYGSTYKMAEVLGISQAAVMRRKKKYGL